MKWNFSNGVHFLMILIGNKLFCEQLYLRMIVVFHSVFSFMKNKFWRLARRVFMFFNGLRIFLKIKFSRAAFENISHGWTLRWESLSDSNFYYR